LPRHLRNLRPAELFSSLPIALPPRERRLTPLSAVRFGRGRPMALAAGEPLPERALTRPHFPPLLGRRNLRALEFQQERARPPVDLGDVSLPQRAASGRHSPAGPSRACSRQPDSALPLFDVRLADGRARSAAAKYQGPLPFWSGRSCDGYLRRGGVDCARPTSAAARGRLASRSAPPCVLQPVPALRQDESGINLLPCPAASALLALAHSRLRVGLRKSSGRGIARRRYRQTSAGTSWSTRTTMCGGVVLLDACDRQRRPKTVERRAGVVSVRSESDATT
jgi:hypothetical protein